MQRPFTSKYEIPIENIKIEAFKLERFLPRFGSLGQSVSEMAFHHVYLNSVQKMVWRIWQESVSRHGLLDTVYPLRIKHLNNVQLMVSGENCGGCVSRHGLLDTVKKHMVLMQLPGV